MKWLVILISLMFLQITEKAEAQSVEVEQLLLDVQKLAQFKQILNDFKKGYQIISTGYNSIKNISEGNFSLHKTFLDGLLSVSPAVIKYKKVAEIIDIQMQLLKEYKSSLKSYRNSQQFTSKEIDYIEKVYKNLLDKSLKNIDELAMVLTAGKLRMTDDERLEYIDKIFQEMEDKIVFLRHFNNSTSVLAVQRSKEQNNIDAMRKILNVK